MSSQRQASSAAQVPHLSPAELSYLYTSLALPQNPIRPDGRSPTQFRPLSAESNILPGTNGSARIGFADGTQAIVGVKAEVERTVLISDTLDVDQDAETVEGAEESASAATGGHGSWVQMSIEIPGFRDDDALPVFLAEMLRESLVGSVGGNEDNGERHMAGGLKGRLVINKRWHWRLYIDVLLLSQPLSYPLPLLSLTTHLALLSTKLPKLKSTGEEDPFFDDDWAAAEYLYPRSSTINSNPSQQVRPPVTLLVISVGENVIFDPSREEIAVADAVLAISFTRNSDSDTGTDEPLKLLLTQRGIANSETENGNGPDSAAAAEEETPGVWRPRRGGIKRSVLAEMMKTALKKGGVGEEVLAGLEGVEVA
ncbi:hypothetical protein N7493_008000 [Penicillium malachiteum]|uniref:Ribosomal RNA-processing protein 42 n=1 Tax=Penicillium malachiteum TaxID=1324776 RepID=A0AAD6HGF9_9EURO|nr:hypothetical protein N7493_008000 [Penicillium malachiteum]